MNFDLYGFGPALAAGTLMTIKLALSALWWAAATYWSSDRPPANPQTPTPQTPPLGPAGGLPGVWPAS